MIKLFKQFNNEQEICYICEKYDIEDYTINNDGSIDVNEDIDLNYLFLNKLPLIFNKVNGEFDCSENELETLEGCPKELNGGFHCQRNNLTTLNGCPKEIIDEFDCTYNKLTSLEGSPEYVKYGFYCSYNNLTTLKGCPIFIGGDFSFGNSPINKIDVECEINGHVYLYNTNLDDKIKKLSQYYIKMLFKHGLDYKIFNDDGSINDSRLNHFLNDFKE